MSADILAAAEAWLSADPDNDDANELRRLIDAGPSPELSDRFEGRLVFGTAGLRGLIGAGPNRMNRAVVRQATAGLARYLLARIPDVTSRGVVVARDARKRSDVFARDTAGVLAAHGIPALVFVERAPTPFGAFATKHLGAAGGVVVTASHNPPAYNGYKVYWENGAQIVPPHDAGIAAEIEAAGPANGIPCLEEGEARARGLWRDLGDEVGVAYLAAIATLLLHPGEGRDLRIVYTALHGVGAIATLKALSGAGFAHVFSVKEQEQPDGGFPTVAFPNPEEPGALDLSLALAEREGADLLLANDPDADRLAAAARTADGSMKAFSGNEIGVILGHYRLTHHPAASGIPLVLTTIVSSAQLSVLARDLGARYEETLTGFKWIMNRALEIERTDAGVHTVFGYEEALGYSCGDVVRDKDGISSALVFADLAGWCRARGLTVWGYLEEIQRKHGLFLSGQKSVTILGREGVTAIAGIMNGFRERPPERIGGLEVVATKDFQRRILTRGGVDSDLSLPPSNVLAYELEGGSRVTLRPSGTEPKIKYYFELVETPGEGEPIATAAARGNERLAALMTDFVALALERGQPA